MSSTAFMIIPAVSCVSTSDGVVHASAQPVIPPVASSLAWRTFIRARPITAPKASIEVGSSYFYGGRAMERYNLLVTFHPNQAGLAEKEVRKRVEDVGGAVEEIEHSSVNGVFCVKVAGDPKETVRAIKEDIQGSPEAMFHTHHWVPVDVWVESNDEEMLDAVDEAAKGIGEHESWMMHVHKRHHPRHSEELMLTLTDHIQKGRVDLKHPDKIIAVEVLGSMAAVSLLKREEIIDVNRMRLEVGLTQLV
jgi:tRNA(Ser,Leu) C12 N-acetylase TAN1